MNASELDDAILINAILLMVATGYRLERLVYQRGFLLARRACYNVEG